MRIFMFSMFHKKNDNDIVKKVDWINVGILIPAFLLDELKCTVKNPEQGLQQIFQDCFRNQEQITFNGQPIPRKLLPPPSLWPDVEIMRIVLKNQEEKNQEEK